jgi:hypothetical protein
MLTPCETFVDRNGESWRLLGMDEPYQKGDRWTICKSSADDTYLVDLHMWQIGMKWRQFMEGMTRKTSEAACIGLPYVYRMMPRTEINHSERRIIL